MTDKSYQMTKRQACLVYGNQSRLARALNLTRQCVGLWAWDEPIPDVHALKIRFVLKPKELSLLETDVA